MDISICTWSFHRELAETITLLSLIELVPRKYKDVTQLEICFSHLAGTSLLYLKKVKEALRKSGLAVSDIPFDTGVLAETDAAKRQEALKGFSTGISVAAELGSPFIRFNTGGEVPDDETLGRIIDGYNQIIPEARKAGVKILIENHGGVTNDPAAIKKMIDAVGSDYLGTCPDLGNFPEEGRYEALEKIAPYMKMAHIKTYDFDADGNETTLDIERCLDIFKKVGFDGTLSAEFEGEGDEYEGVAKTVALIKRLW